MGSLLKAIDEFTNMGSGWVFDSGKKAEVNIATYKPFRGGTYIKTPDIVPSRSVINVQNQDHQCFKWAVLSALYPAADHPERVSKYIPNESKLNWTGINFPATIKDVVKFEKINPDVSLCVYKFEGKFSKPIFVSNRMNLDDTHKYRES